VDPLPQGIVVSLRTVERAVASRRRELEAEARATVRFETPPGRQLQIDFGTAAVEIGGAAERVRLFVATLGYSRRNFVAAFKHERQSAWLDGLEGAFRHFGGVPREVHCATSSPPAPSLDHQATGLRRGQERPYSRAPRGGGRPSHFRRHFSNSCDG
jgi:transposase